MKLLALFLSHLLLITSAFSQKEITITAHFSPDKFILSQLELTNLKTSIDTLDKFLIIDVTISAYCDDIGNTAYNKKLSLNRARYIQGLLVDSGIEPPLISSAKGKGELKLEENDDNIQTQRANNRKAEIKFTIATLKNSTNTEESLVELVENVTPVSDPLVETPQNITSINDSLNVGDKMVLEGILFEGGTHKILSESIPIIKKLVDDLKEHSQYHFIIQGHICCSSDNLDGVNFMTGKRNLSEARAEAVYDYLVTNGISKKRLKYEGLKNKFPLGRGDKFDRRVELKVSKIK